MKEINSKVVFILLGLLWFQMAVIPLIQIGDIRPDFLFLFVVFFAFFLDHRRTILCAFLLGCFKDFLTNRFFGLEAASFVLGAAILNEIASRFDREDPWVQSWSTFLFSFSALMIFQFLSGVVEEHASLNLFSLLKSFWISVYTTTLTLPAFSMFRSIVRLRPSVKQYELF